MKIQEVINLKTENRPWGNFINFLENEKCTVKILTLKQNEQTSLQYHELRSEFWYVISGMVEATIDQDKIIMKPTNTAFIPAKTNHRLTAILNSQILEICIGYFKESDIIRIQDKYNR